MMISTNAGAAGVKYAGPMLGVIAADFTIGGIDLELGGAIIVGLFAGAVLRNSRQVADDAGWKAIRKDLLLSVMSGMANFIIAAVVVASGTLAVPGFPVLAAAGVGLFFGHQGPDAINWFNRKFLGKDEPSEPRYAADPKRITKSMRDLVEKFDDDDPDKP